MTRPALYDIIFCINDRNHRLYDRAVRCGDYKRRRSPQIDVVGFLQPLCQYETDHASEVAAVVGLI